MTAGVSPEAAADKREVRPTRARSSRSRAGAEPLSLARRVLVGLSVALALLVIELRLGDSAALRSLELQTLDWRFRWRGPVQAGPETVLVMIDDRSVAELGAWPVPRRLVATALDRLAQAEVAVIALDLLFAEAGRPLPLDLRELLEEAGAALPPPSTELRQRIRDALGSSGHDRELALAIRSAQRVIVPYAFVFDPAQANRTEVPPWIAATAYRVRTAATAGEPSVPPPPRGLLAPASELGVAGVSAGHVTLLLEVDGSLRAALPAIAFRDESYPSLPVETVRRFLGRSRAELRLDADAVRLGALRLPLDQAGRHLVNHYGPQGTLPTFALIDLLQGRLDPAKLRGRLVVIGASAAGAGDRFATPFTPRLPGAEFLGTTIDNMLHDRALRRNDAVRTLDLLAIVILPLLTALLAGRRSPLGSLLVVLAAVVAWAALAQLAFERAHLWLAGLAPAAAAVAAGVAVEGLRLAQERRRRQALERQRANLGRYFPPSVVERLALSDASQALEGSREATVMFVDIVGFTRIAERLSPEAAMDLLRAFHTEVERAVFAQGGMVDKFMGDGVMACFGVPDPVTSASADALHAALALLQALAAPLAGRSGQRLEVGIGLHRGPVLMGNLGGSVQVQFTVVGDAVNVASRLEALTRSVGTALIVSETALAAARPHLEPALLARLQPLPEVALRGRAEPIRTWRLADADPAAPR